MLNVGKAVSYILTNSTTITALIDPDNIYPLVITEEPEPVMFPAIVYERTGYSSLLMKNCPSDREAAETITIHTEDYGSSVDIAQAVLDAMEQSSGDIEGVRIEKINLVSASEAYDNPVFTQRLIFTIQ